MTGAKMSLFKHVRAALLLLSIVLFATPGGVVAFNDDTAKYENYEIYFYDANSCKEASAITNGGDVDNGGKGGSGPAPASREEFVLKNAEPAFKIGKENGIPYDAMIAQGAYESGNGKSGLTTQANNFFGIKAGDSWTGAVWVGGTLEEEGGKKVKTTAAFRAYPTPEAGWQGYAEFIRTNKRYATALKYPKDPFQYLVELRTAGYATDSSYIPTSHSILRSVQKIIAEKTQLPPSSEVEPDIQPPGGDSSSGSNGGTATKDEGVGDQLCGKGSGAGGSGPVTADGYAYPISAKKSEQKNSALSGMPCPLSFCHGGGSPGRPATPAFDLGKTDDNATVGTPVYAMHDAKIISVKDNYKGNAGCFSISYDQINSKNKSDDGWNYWSGHLENPLVANGKEVKAGDQIASIGRRECTGNGSEPHLHIDRGSPKGRGGGAQCCRDPGLVPIMNKLWEGLPE